VGSGQTQTYNFQIVGTGTDSASTTHSQTVSFTSAFDFSLTAITPSQTVKAGATATYSLDLAPIAGSFPATVTLSCSGLPNLSGCAFDHSQVSAGAGDTPITLNITTAAAIASSSPSHYGGFVFFAMLLPLSGLVLLADEARKALPARRSILFLATMTATCLIIPLIACGGGGLSGNRNNGGGGQPGTKPGTYSVNVTAAMGLSTKSAQVILVVQ
jgi:hypothetical protein